MVSQLHSSRAEGAKDFTVPETDVQFGWAAILSMWDREKKRRNDNQIRLVPRLNEGFVKRDSWTRLNVPPAKIMQVISNPSNLCLRHK